MPRAWDVYVMKSKASFMLPPRDCMHGYPSSLPLPRTLLETNMWHWPELFWKRGFLWDVFSPSSVPETTQRLWCVSLCLRRIKDWKQHWLCSLNMHASIPTTEPPSYVQAILGFVHPICLWPDIIFTQVLPLACFWIRGCKHQCAWWRVATICVLTNMHLILAIPKRVANERASSIGVCQKSREEI